MLRFDALRLAVPLLGALLSGNALALTHDRIPGDDLGGGTTLPAVRAMSEDVRTPAYGGTPTIVPGAPLVPDRPGTV